jgi:NMD protein affecting ribosome stability and mRNA decay
MNSEKERKGKICGIKTLKLYTSLCPYCRTDNIYYKSHGKNKYLCKECNIYLEENQLIPIPYELLIDRVILIMRGEYYKRLEEFKKSLNEKGNLQQIKSGR